ncbi:hypothetical protein ABPG72_006232 [Tetrahymena utriculariae]
MNKILFFFIFISSIKADNQLISQNIIQIQNANISIFEDFRCQSVLGFNIPIYLGTPSQVLVVTLFLSSPDNISFAYNFNMIFNSKCSVQSLCPYALSNLGLLINFIKKKNHHPQSKAIENEIFSGNIVTDQVKFFPNDLNDGIIDLSNGNENNIFTKGYLQKKLISPKFQFSYDKTGKTDLRFNQTDQSQDELPALQTFSKQLWGFLMVGLQIENLNVLPLAHYQTVVIQFYTTSALPKKIVELLNKQYSQYFLNGGKYNQLNSEICFGQISFVDIIVNTKEYKLVIPLRHFFNFNSDLQCEINVSRTNILIGIQYIQNQNIKFDPLNSTLQFPNEEKQINSDQSKISIQKNDIICELEFLSKDTMY